MEEIFKISINKDSRNQDVNLGNISLEAAESLKVFIDSLTSFCENYSPEERSMVSFAIKPGSLQLTNSMQENSVIRNEFTQILYGINNNDFKELSHLNNCTNKVKAIRQIQDKIISNGLEYSVSFFPKKGESIDMSKTIKNRIKNKLKTYVYKYEVVFLEGLLYEVGGKNAVNIHLMDGENEYKIDTDKETAYDFSHLLYKNVYLSAVKITSDNPNKEIEYNFLDKYVSEETYNKYKDLYKNIQKMDISEQSELIYDYLQDNFKEHKFGDNIKFLKLFNNQSSDRGLLRFLLLSSKNYLKINANFDEMYYTIASSLNKK